MNWTIKDATAKRFSYETHDQLREQVANFVAAYNFAKRFTSNPHQQSPGPNR